MYLGVSQGVVTLISGADMRITAPMQRSCKKRKASSIENDVMLSGDPCLCTHSIGESSTWTIVGTGKLF
jgi:hypothetical protein